MSAKARRQQILVRLIEHQEISSQPQLVALLAEAGIAATQATVSRDLEDIGAVKVRVPGGASVYAIPEFEPDRRAPGDQLRRVLGEWVVDVASSGPLVVLRTPPGCAHVVASALDRGALDGLLGTVAGDDTVIVVAAQDVGGDGLARQLRSLAGIDERRPAVSGRSLATGLETGIGIGVEKMIDNARDTEYDDAR